MADIFDEVAEDLRAERAHRLLMRYGGFVVAAAVLVVAAAGGWQAWKYEQGRRGAGMAGDYLAAMRIADASKGTARQAAIAGFAAVAAKAGPGYRNLALLQEAGLKAEAGDLAGASALWDQVAGDGAADPLLRDLANLQWALHQIDTGNPAVVAARLSVLAAPSNPWHALAQEGQAMLELRQGKTGAARDTLKLLAHDPAATDGVRRRAEGMLERLGG